jgi:hypothetical protein
MIGSKLRSVRTSVNSFLRRAKSLFAPGATKHLSIQLPSPLPFEGIAFEPRQSMRYRSNIDAEELTRAAQIELAEQDPNVFLAFLLTLAWVAKDRNRPVGMARLPVGRETDPHRAHPALRGEDRALHRGPTGRSRGDGGLPGAGLPGRPRAS